MCISYELWDLFYLILLSIIFVYLGFCLFFNIIFFVFLTFWKKIIETHYNKIYKSSNSNSWVFIFEKKN